MSVPLRPQARPAARRVLDVEDVLSWAYREELPKGRHGGRAGAMGFPSVSPMFRGAVHGTPIDNWSREPGFPAAVGDTHPDAHVVEAVVSSIGRLEGYRIEGEAGLMGDLGFDVDQDAAVARALERTEVLLVSYAKLGARPPWEQRCWPRAVLAANNKPGVFRTETQWREELDGEVTLEVPCAPVRAGRYPEGAFCRITYDPTPLAIVRERAERLVWWIGLCLVADALAGLLATIAVLPPSAPARPWTGEADAGKPPNLFRPEAVPAVHAVGKRWTPEAAAAERKLAARRQLPRESYPTLSLPMGHHEQNGNGHNGAA